MSATCNRGSVGGRDRDHGRTLMGQINRRSALVLTSLPAGRSDLLSACDQFVPKSPGGGPRESRRGGGVRQRHWPCGDTTFASEASGLPARGSTAGSTTSGRNILAFGLVVI